MRIAKMKCCQGNMNFETCILLIMDAWPVNVRISVVSAYIESKSVCCGVSAAVIIGPYFFNDGNERAAAVNGELYRHTLQTFRGTVNWDDIWFQQDGTTSHTTRDTL